VHEIGIVGLPTVLVVPGQEVQPELVQGYPGMIGGAVLVPYPGYIPELDPQMKSRDRSHLDAPAEEAVRQALPVGERVIGEEGQPVPPQRPDPQVGHAELGLRLHRELSGQSQRVPATGPGDDPQHHGILARQ